MLTPLLVLFGEHAMEQNPRKGKPCSICSSPFLIDLQRLAAEGVSLGELASRFPPITKASLSRHFRAHVPQSNAKGGRKNAAPIKGKKGSRLAVDGRCPQCEQLVGETTEALSPEAIVKRAERILHVSESIALRAQQGEDSRLALLAVDRCQRSIDTLAKITGLIKNEVVIDQRQVNIYQGWSDDALRVLSALHDALAEGIAAPEALKLAEASVNKSLAIK